MSSISYSFNIFSIIFDYAFFLIKSKYNLDIHMVYMFALSIHYVKVCLPRTNKCFSNFSSETNDENIFLMIIIPWTYKYYIEKVFYIWFAIIWSPVLQIKDHLSLKLFYQLILIFSNTYLYMSKLLLQLENEVCLCATVSYWSTETSKLVNSWNEKAEVLSNTFGHVEDMKVAEKILTFSKHIIKAWRQLT